MIDEVKIEQAIRLFLEAIGEDIDRQGIKDTPQRISEMCSELFGGIGRTASDHLSVTFNTESNKMVLEKELKRVRSVHWGPRTIDLDILLYDDQIIQSEDLTIPHVEMDKRIFVLEPMAEIAPWFSLKESKMYSILSAFCICRILGCNYGIIMV